MFRFCCLSEQELIDLRPDKMYYLEDNIIDNEQYYALNSNKNVFCIEEYDYLKEEELLVIGVCYHTEEDESHETVVVYMNYYEYYNLK